MTVLLRLSYLIRWRLGHGSQKIKFIIEIRIQIIPLIIYSGLFCNPRHRHIVIYIKKQLGLCCAVVNCKEIFNLSIFTPLGGAR